MKTDAPPTLSRCPHCRKDTGSGTHNGCYECRKVKHTTNGKIDGPDIGADTRVTYSWVR